MDLLFSNLRNYEFNINNCYLDCFESAFTGQKIENDIRIYNPAWNVCLKILKRIPETENQNKDDGDTARLMQLDLKDLYKTQNTKNAILYPCVETPDYVWNKNKIVRPNYTQRKDGAVPLIVAAYRCDVTALKLLLGFGCDPNVVMKNGNSALMEAVNSSTEEDKRINCIKMLLKSNALAGLTNETGHSAITIASVNDDVEVLQLIHGFRPTVDWNAKTFRGHTALTLALAHRNYDVAHYLVTTVGVDMTVEDHNKLTSVCWSQVINPPIAMQFCVYLDETRKLQPFIEGRMQALRIKYRDESVVRIIYQVMLLLLAFREARKTVISKCIPQFLYDCPIWKSNNIMVSCDRQHDDNDVNILRIGAWVVTLLTCLRHGDHDTMVQFFHSHTASVFLEHLNECCTPKDGHTLSDEVKFGVYSLLMPFFASKRGIEWIQEKVFKYDQLLHVLSHPPTTSKNEFSKKCTAFMEGIYKIYKTKDKNCVYFVHKEQIAACLRPSVPMKLLNVISKIPALNKEAARYKGELESEEVTLMEHVECDKERRKREKKKQKLEKKRREREKNGEALGVADGFNQNKLDQAYAHNHHLDYKNNRNKQKEDEDKTLVEEIDDDKTLVENLDDSDDEPHAIREDLKLTKREKKRLLKSRKCGYIKELAKDKIHAKPKTKAVETQPGATKKTDGDVKTSEPQPKEDTKRLAKIPQDLPLPDQAEAHKMATTNIRKRPNKAKRRASFDTGSSLPNTAASNVGECEKKTDTNLTNKPKTNPDHLVDPSNEQVDTPEKPVIKADKPPKTPHTGAIPKPLPRAPKTTEKEARFSQRKGPRPHLILNFSAALKGNSNRKQQQNDNLKSKFSILPDIQNNIKGQSTTKPLPRRQLQFDSNNEQDNVADGFDHNELEMARLISLADQRNNAMPVYDHYRSDHDLVDKNVKCDVSSKTDWRAAVGEGPKVNGQFVKNLEIEQSNNMEQQNYIDEYSSFDHKSETTKMDNATSSELAVESKMDQQNEIEQNKTSTDIEDVCDNFIHKPQCVEKNTSGLVEVNNSEINRNNKANTSSGEAKSDDESPNVFRLDDPAILTLGKASNTNIQFGDFTDLDIGADGKIYSSNPNANTDDQKPPVSPSTEMTTDPHLLDEWKCKPPVLTSDSSTPFGTSKLFSTWQQNILNFNLNTVNDALQADLMYNARNAPIKRPPGFCMGPTQTQPVYQISPESTNSSEDDIKTYFPSAYDGINNFAIPGFNLNNLLRQCNAKNDESDDKADSPDLSDGSEVLKEQQQGTEFKVGSANLRSEGFLNEVNSVLNGDVKHTTSGIDVGSSSHDSKKDVEPTLQEETPIPIKTKPQFVENWMPRSERWRHLLEKLTKLDASERQKVGSINFCLSDYSMIIAEGSCGTVVTVGIRDDGSEVAVKRMLKSNVRMIKNELKNLRLPDLEHENIVRYKDYVEDENFGYLALELCECTLDEYVQFLKFKNKLDENSKRLIKQLLRGLAALHHAKVLHMDLKPRNVLVDMKGNLRLTDFGLSTRLLDDNMTVYRDGIQGTRCWRPPEALRTQGKDENTPYKQQSDIFVAGLIVHYIVSGGEHLFGNDSSTCEANIKSFNVQIDQHERPGFYMDLLINWMCNPLVQKRKPAYQCLLHPFFWSESHKFELILRFAREPEVQNNMECLALKTLRNAARYIGYSGWQSFVNQKLLSEVMKYTQFPNGPLGIIKFMYVVDYHFHSLPEDLRKEIDEPANYLLKLFPRIFLPLFEIIRECGWMRRRSFRQFYYDLSDGDRGAAF